MPFELQPGPRGGYRVDGFRSGRFVVGGELRSGGIVIWPGGIVDLEGGIAADAFAPLLTAQPPLDVILIGTGAAHCWPDAGLLEAIRRQGIAVDVMTSQLAARTYNVLLGEGRQAGALLLPLQA